MDQREILLQNLERAQSRKVNKEEFTEEFLVSLAFSASASAPRAVWGASPAATRAERGTSVLPLPRFLLLGNNNVSSNLLVGTPRAVVFVV